MAKETSWILLGCWCHIYFMTKLITNIWTMDQLMIHPRFVYEPYSYDKPHFEHHFWTMDYLVSPSIYLQNHHFEVTSSADVFFHICRPLCMAAYALVHEADGGSGVYQKGICTWLLQTILYKKRLFQWDGGKPKSLHRKCLESSPCPSIHSKLFFFL